MFSPFGRRATEEQGDVVRSFGASFDEVQEVQVHRTILPARERYVTTLELEPGVKELLGEDARIIQGGDPSFAAQGGENEYEDGDELDDGEVEGAEWGEDRTIRTAGDYSYSASSYAGPGYRIVGDAGGMSSLVPH